MLYRLAFSLGLLALSLAVGGIHPAIAEEAPLVVPVNTCPSPGGLSGLGFMSGYWMTRGEDPHLGPIELDIIWSLPKGVSMVGVSQQVGLENYLAKSGYWKIACIRGKLALFFAEDSGRAYKYLLEEMSDSSVTFVNDDSFEPGVNDVVRWKFHQEKENELIISIEYCTQQGNCNWDSNSYQRQVGFIE